MLVRSGLFAAFVSTLIVGSAVAEGFILKPVEDAEYTLRKPLDPGKIKDGAPDEAFDISGIACRPAEDRKARYCLVVNDEGRQAQAIKIKNRTIKPEETVKLIRKSTLLQTLGTQPTNRGCVAPDGDAKAADEFDGEGVAFAGGYYFVVGSHGCGRKKNKFKPSSMRLARIPTDENGDPDEDGVETTYRLGDALASAPEVKDYFLQPLQGAGKGLNVEGIAVIGDRLYAGLRAPSLGDIAYLVSASVKGLFADGHEQLAETPKTIALKVGTGVGIRDLAPLDDGRLLVLTGPAQEQTDVEYSLFVATLPSGEVTLLGHLDALEGQDRHGKAEAVTVVSKNRVLVLFDSLASGGPREYEVLLDR